jgi:hypothetical protein
MPLQLQEIKKIERIIIKLKNNKNIEFFFPMYGFSAISASYRFSAVSAFRCFSFSASSFLKVLLASPPTPPLLPTPYSLPGTAEREGLMGYSPPNNFGHFELIICYLKYQQSSSVFSYKLIV